MFAIIGRVLCDLVNAQNLESCFGIHGLTNRPRRSIDLLKGEGDQNPKDARHDKLQNNLWFKKSNNRDDDERRQAV